jgi:hypothetical protein
VEKKARKNPHAVALGRKGGLVKSAAKTRAVRENAKRPRKKALLQKMVSERSRALLAKLLNGGSKTPKRARPGARKQ